MIHYKKGNLFDDLHPDDYLIHVVNDLGCMGAGFAGELRYRFPNAGEIYEDWFKATPTGKWNYKITGYPDRDSNRLGMTQFANLGLNVVSHDENGEPVWECFRLAQMIAQHGVISKNNPHPLDYDALTTCLKHVKADLHFECLAHQRPFRLISPLLGAGLAGGDWCVIQQLINEVFDDRDITVYVLNEEDLPEQFRHLLT